MVKLKAHLIFALLSALCSFGLAWGIQSNRYEAKLLKQEVTFKDVQTIIQNKHLETLNLQNEVSRKSTEEYRSEINQLTDAIKVMEAINNEHTFVIDGLREQERYLHSRISSVSEQAVREYALTASTALREVTEALEREQRSHQETSAEADGYYFAWKALDKSWPVK